MQELSVILRIDGSLGSFGPSGIENIANKSGCVECDLVIEDLDWGALSDLEIYGIIRVRVIDAVCDVLQRFNVELPRGELEMATLPAVG